MKCREGARFEDIKLTELDHLRYRLREAWDRMKNAPTCLASRHMVETFLKTELPKPSATHGLGHGASDLFSSRD